MEQAPPLDYGDPTAPREPTEVDGIVGYTVEMAAYTRAPAEPLRVHLGPKNGGLLAAEANGEPWPGQRFWEADPAKQSDDLRLHLQRGRGAPGDRHGADRSLVPA